MKLVHIHLSIIIISLGLLLGLASCKELPDDEFSDQQKFAQMLQKGSPWGGDGKVTILKQPLEVDTKDLLDLTVSFTTTGDPAWEPRNFVSKNAVDFLSATTASWQWVGNDASNIELISASTSILSSVYVSEDSIAFSFEVSNISSGRVAGINGQYRVGLTH